jgi:RHS repeat-associated protein
MKLLAAAAALFCFFTAVSPAQAQTLPNPTSDDQMGMQPYQSYHGGDIDVVNLSTGTLNLNMPFLSYPQRGKLHLSFNLYYNNEWQHRGKLCPPHVSCEWIWGYNSSEGGPLERSDVFVGSAQQFEVAGTNVPASYYGGGGGLLYTLYFANWSLVAADGSKHPIANMGSMTELGQTPSFYYQYSGPFETLDATGWRTTGTLTSSTAGTGEIENPTAILDSDGVAYATANAFEEDPNGNMITLSNGVYADSLNRQIPNPPNIFSSSNTGTSACPQGLLAVDHAVQWSVPGPNGATVNYVFCYVKVAINIPPGTPSTEYPAYVGSPRMSLQTIVLPNGQSWGFQYNDPGDGSTYNGSPVNYGTLTQVALPTGGSISYTYTYVSGSGGNCENGGRWVSGRTVNANDGSGPHTWTYSYGSGTATVSDPVGNYTVHTFGFGGSCALYETQAESYQNGGTLLKTVNTTYNSSTSRNVPTPGYVNVVPARIATVWPNGKTSQVTKSYDSGYSYTDYLGSPSQAGIYGKVTSEAETDYGQGVAGSLLRTTNTTYQAFQNSNYLTNNLLNLPYSVQVTDGGGTQRAYTYFLYDEGGTRASSGISTQRNTSPPDSPYWGNQTSAHHWLNTTSSYLTSTATYFDTGEVNIATDPNLNPTTFAYSATYAGAYPTTVTNALTQPTNHTYDFNTGLLASTTDPNNQTTSYTYDMNGTTSLPGMRRITQIGYPDGGQISFCYSDTPGTTCSNSTPPFQVVATKKITSSQNKVTTYIFDGLGRTSQSQLANPDLSCPIIETDFSYDGLGRKSTVSNPHCGSARTTDGTTTYGYDGLSRVILVTQPDSSTIHTAFCAGTTLVTDEASHWRRSTADALGRLIEVDEPNSLTATVNSNGCPGTGEAIWVTNYTYDALDDLSAVVQNSSRNRNFVYDSLKRLTSATNPESGTTTYTYDGDGNVVTKTVPAQNQTGSLTVTLSYCYDGLNRMKSKAYTNQSCPMSSPVATYGYDGIAPVGCSPTLSSTYPIGRRTGMCDAAGNEAWSYDTMGRPLTDQRVTNGVTKSTVYLYLPYVDGSINTLTYPSTRTITYTTDSAGRQSEAQDVANGINYALGSCNNGVSSNGVCYAPQGALGLIQNGANLVTTYLYNDRLQPCWTYATSGAPPTPLPWNTTSTNCTSTFATGSVLDLKYNFSLGTDNGNVTGITNDGVPNRSQNFAYDQLNRISTAETTSTHATDPTNCWGEAYVYDSPGGPAAWGNLIQINSPSSAYTGCTGEPLNLSLGTLTNNQISGWCYDASGNVLAESTCPMGPPYVYMYDAENHLTSTAGVTYTYDGDGKRVQKSSGMLYWYGMRSDTLDETNSAGTMTDEYIFFGGKRIARRDPSNNVVYYFADHLATSRIVASAAGSILDNSDFYPFGGERVIQSGSGNTYKFTGKERDTESNLDNFGARYNSSAIGRFMSPDTLKFTRDLSDPQSWNKYAYSFNRPTVFVDDDGKWPTWFHHQVNQDEFAYLGAHAVEVINNASDWVDSFTNGNQAADRSYMHAMSNGTVHQTVADAAADTERWITSELNHAEEAQLNYEATGGKGMSDEALTHFGHAVHTVEDRTSPEHAGYQPWNGMDTLAGGKMAIAHKRAEDRSSVSSDARDAEARYEAHVAAAMLWHRYQEELRRKREEQKKKKEELP